MSAQFINWQRLSIFDLNFAWIDNLIAFLHSDLTIWTNVREVCSLFMSHKPQISMLISLATTLDNKKSYACHLFTSFFQASSKLLPRSFHQPISVMAHAIWPQSYRATNSHYPPVHVVSIPIDQLRCNPISAPQPQAVLVDSPMSMANRQKLSNENIPQSDPLIDQPATSKVTWKGKTSSNFPSTYPYAHIVPGYICQSLWHQQPQQKCPG